MSTANKLTYLNVTKQKLKQAINNIGGEVTDETTFRQYVNQLENAYDRLPKTEFEEGENVTLENTLKGKLDFQDGKVGFGQAKQETTQGYNLINVAGARVDNPVNGVSVSKDGDSIILNGSRTDGSTTNSKNVIYATNSLNLESGDYRLTFVPESGSLNGGRLGVLFINSNGAGIAYIEIFSGTTTTKSITLNSAVATLTVFYNGAFSATNYKFKVMLSQGTTERAYEPYTRGYSSPSPNWKQPIEYVRGKNLLPLNEADFTQTFYGQNAEIKDEVIKISGSATQVYSISIGKNGLVLPSDTSRITFKVNSGTYKYTQFNSGASYSGINVRLKDEDTDTMYSTGSTITLSETHTFSINLYVADTSSKNAEIKIQLEEGTQATSFKPYNTIEETISGKNRFNVTDYSNFNVQPNVQAVITKETNKVKIAATAGNYSGGYVTYDNWKSYIDNYVEGENYYISFDVTANVNMTDLLYGIAGASAHTTLTANTKKRVITSMSNQNALVFYNMSGVVAEITIENIMITKANDSTYEPYITPTSYQFSLGDHKFYGIGTYRDYILRTTGKNLLNIANFEEGYSIGFDGLPGTYTTTARITNTTPIDVEGLDKVTLSFTAWTGGDKFIYSLLKSDNTLVARETAKTSGTTITIGEAKYLYICFYDGATLSNVKDAMLVKGSTAMDFQPYGSGNWYKYANVGEVVLDGVNNLFINRFSADVSTKYRFVWNDTSNGIKNLGNTTKTTLCDKLKQTTAAENYAKVEGIAANSNVLVYVEEISEYSVENANQWLQNNVLDVYYLLNIPILTPITGTLAEQLEEWWNGQSLDGTTIIEGNGDLPLLIEVRALKGA